MRQSFYIRSNKVGSTLGFAFLMLSLVGSLFGAPADFDTTFGTNGKTTTAVGNGNSFILDTAMQADGKIVAVGAAALNGSDFVVLRYNASGALDTSFDGDGMVFTDLGSTNDSAKAVAVQADGKILVAGGTLVNNRLDFALVRYLPSGALDTSFDTDGKVVTSVDTWGDLALSIAIQFDGRIVVAGYSEDGSFDERFAAVRYNVNGAVDSSFGTDGKAVLPVGANSEGAKEVLIQSDCKVMLVGSGATGNTGTDFILARLNANGTPDNSFDGDGKVVTSISVTDRAAAAAQQADGKIIVAGYADDANSSSKFAAVRYHPNGARDNDFGLFGIFTAQIGQNFEDAATALALQPDGKIFLAGVTKTGFENYDLALMRLNAGGGADQTFGTSGKVILPLSNKDDSVNDVILQPNGRIILAGASLDANQRFSFTLARLLGRKTVGDYDSDGRADIGVYRPSTGVWYIERSLAGTSVFQFGLSGDRPVVGDYDGDAREDFAVWRPSDRVWYLMRSTAGFAALQFGLAGDIPVPADYDHDGKTDPAVFRPSNGVWYIQRSQLGFTALQFGLNGDRPVTGDFDRDGRADFAVWRPSNGVWYVQKSTGGTSIVQFGLAGDIPVAGDFDGDLANDFVVFRPADGTWHVLRSSDALYQAVQFGTAGDVPTGADFDGDGRSDYGVFRPSGGTWYVLKSSDASAFAYNFGLSADLPVSSFISQ